MSFQRMNYVGSVDRVSSCVLCVGLKQKRTQGTNQEKELCKGALGITYHSVANDVFLPPQFTNRLGKSVDGTVYASFDHYEHTRKTFKTPLTSS